MSTPDELTFHGGRGGGKARALKEMYEHAAASGDRVLTVETCQAQLIPCRQCDATGIHHPSGTTCRFCHGKQHVIENRFVVLDQQKEQS